jgi:hypothetical protein
MLICSPRPIWPLSPMLLPKLLSTLTKLLACRKFGSWVGEVCGYLSLQGARLRRIEPQPAFSRLRHPQACASAHSTRLRDWHQRHAARISGNAWQLLTLLSSFFGEDPMTGHRSARPGNTPQPLPRPPRPGDPSRQPPQENRPKGGNGGGNQPRGGGGGRGGNNSQPSPWLGHPLDPNAQPRSHRELC